MTNPSPNKGGSKWLIIILVVVGAGLVLGCGCCGGAWWLFWRGAEAATAKLEQKAKDGTLVEFATGGRVAVGKLPASFPKDIPVYDGATILVGGAGNDGGKSAGGVMMTVKAKAQTVVDYYSKNMIAEGWQRDSMTTAEQMTVMTFKKGDRKAGVMVSDGGNGETNIELTHEEN